MKKMRSFPNLADAGPTRWDPGFHSPPLAAARSLYGSLAVMTEGRAVTGLGVFETILSNTPKIIDQAEAEPSKEADVQRAVLSVLRHAFRDVVQDIHLGKNLKVYKPDIGVRSLMAAAEYKFIDSATEAKATVGHAEAAFYLPFSRAWELLAGVLLALWKPVIRRPSLQHAAGVTGLGLILAACLLFTKDTDWPGAAALVPVLGAVLVIAAGEGGIAGRLLATRPMVWIGLLSYSLYLWHWPLLTFQRFVLPGAWPAAITVLASILLAALSLRYVERPFRSSAFLTRRQGKFKEASAGDKGGVRLAKSIEEVNQFAKEMLGATLVTVQTGMDLALHHPDRTAELLGGHVGILGAHDRHALGNRHAELFQHGLRLIFMNIHIV
eukprot:gene38901-52539_t